MLKFTSRTKTLRHTICGKEHCALCVYIIPLQYEMIGLNSIFISLLSCNKIHFLLFFDLFFELDVWKKTKVKIFVELFSNSFIRNQRLCRTLKPYSTIPCSNRSPFKSNKFEINFALAIYKS